MVDKALERDRDRRYHTAADMAEALERAARAAANASATDLGVASPREVAAYVQGALGEDIAAQRESVRAWLAHSEPNMPRMTGVKAGDSGKLGPPPGHDVTMKMPLDRAVALASRHLPPTPPLASQRVPPSNPPPVSATSPSAQSPLRAPPAPHAAPNVREALGIPAHHADGASLDETPVEPSADDEDDHETLLMDREAAIAEIARQKALKAAGQARGPAPRVAPFPEEGTSSTSTESFMVPAPPPPNRTPQLVALGVGVLIAVAGVVTWWLLASEQTTPQTIAAPGNAAPPTPPEPTTPARVNPTPATTPAPPVNAQTPAPVVDAGVVRLKGPMPKGKATATPTAAPLVMPTPEPLRMPDPPKPPPEPKAADDMDNPYKKH